jgi:hypothetical protein
VLQLS